MTLQDHICAARTYHYNGWDFEYPPSSGPWPVKRDGELYKRCGKKFYNDLEGFFKMSDSEKEKCRTGGGCIYFEED
jgi:hypothetical protein